jgi:hypothetical protein
MLKRNVFAAKLMLLFLAGAEACFSEPWLDSRNAGLRADIERLSAAGVLTVPINTWPLMWSGILRDLDDFDAQQYPNLQASYGRVMAEGSKALRSTAYSASAKISFASDTELLRHFGSDSRGQGSLRLRRSGLSRHFAYNLELTQVNNPWDGDQTYYDNSYFGFVWGNWVGLVGKVEKWWGPGWNSSLILSNNARPAPGLMVQRNYSETSELPLLRWLGPWTASLFASKLDDQRHINNAKLVGMTLGFRPWQSLEINLRRTAQWGGDGRPEGLKSFIELLTGIADNCETAECRVDEPGNQLGAIDISWHPTWLGGTLYVQSVGEDESGALPSRSSRQYGFKKSIDTEFFAGQLFIEHDNTSTVSFSNHYNILYNHSIYQTGYRYQGRVIGATWDNDSKITSVGILGYLDNGDALEARFSHGEINIDSINGSPSLHSITTQGGAFNSLSAKWQRSFVWGKAELQGRYTDSLIDEFGRQDNRLSIGASLTYLFE